MSRAEDFRGQHFVFLVGYIGQLGGAERQALLTATMLRDQIGARVSFLGWSKSPGLMTDALSHAGIPVYIHPLNWGRPGGGIRSQLGRFSRLIGFARFARNEVKPDYLLPYVGENSKIAGAIWRFAGAKYTWWNQRDEGRAVQGTPLERWTLRTVPDIVANSWAGRDFLIEKLGVPREKVRVINNAVVIPGSVDGSTWRERLGLGPHAKLILMVANLTRYKDHATLLDAFALVKAREPNASNYHLALAGKAEETAGELKARAFDLGLGGSVHFLGAVPDVHPLYAASDLVVHSSLTEGCPNAVLEGMAHSRCVIGTDISGLRQALGEADEFLAPEKDAERLAELMIRWLGDDEGRRRAGLENKKRIQTEFSPERLLASVLDGIAERATDRAS